MAYKHMLKFLSAANHLKTIRNGTVHLNLMLYHCSGESHEDILSYECYEKAYQKIERLTHSLKNVDLIDGRLVNVKDDSVIIDDHIDQRMHTFKSLVRAFLGCPSIHQTVQKNDASAFAAGNCAPLLCFSKPSEREPMVVNSLTKVSNFLNVSAQQRKTVRLTICPQVTQYRIWMGAVEEILKGLKLEIDLLNDQRPNKGIKMSQQIVSSCLKFLAEMETSYDPDSTSWMRLSPAKVVDSPVSSKWEDILEMFNDLIKCLEREKGVLHHVLKLEIMKEGLCQIKDVLIDKHIGYKEARRQESLVQKKLSKTLGYSSQCLFTLLLYYLYGQVRDIEVDVCGGVYANTGDNRFTLCMGRILTSDDEKMLFCGVKQLDRALRLFKFVWETVAMKWDLDMQGHLWCVGAAERYESSNSLWIDTNMTAELVNNGKTSPLSAPSVVLIR